MSNVNISAVIEALVERINQTEKCFYDRAPAKEKLPFCVLGGIKDSDLSEGTLVRFDIDLWGDDKDPVACEEIEASSDRLQNALDGAIVGKDGIFLGHIQYENRDPSADRETDLLHRRLFFTARIFYYS